MKKSIKLLSFTLLIVILLSSTTGVFAKDSFTLQSIGGEKYKKVNSPVKWSSQGSIYVGNNSIKSNYYVTKDVAIPEGIKFKDIKSTDWFAETVINLADKGIINGYDDGTFRPQKEVLTSEFLKLALETAGIEIDYTVKPWHKDIMGKALEHKIISKTLYNSPNEPIKRKDVAVVLAKLIENTPSLKSEFINERSKEYDRFKYLIYDTTTLSEEYRNSIYKLFEYQVIIGTTNKKDQVFYNPESNLTRAEVAAIIERLIEPRKRLDKYAEYPNRDSIFKNEKLSDMTSTYYIKPDIENQRFLYTYDELGKVTKDVVLSEKLNPNINKQIYELTKVTLDKNHFIAITPTEYNTKDSKVFYQFAKGSLYALNDNHLWRFIFREEKGLNIKESYFDSSIKDLSKNSIISFSLGKLWRDDVPDGWIDYFYADKLRASFIAIFGEREGHEIYEYVVNEYVEYRLAGSAESTGYKYVYQTKDIGNIHIDFVTGDSSTLHFYFSYIK